MTELVREICRRGDGVEVKCPGDPALVGAWLLGYTLAARNTVVERVIANRTYCVDASGILLGTNDGVCGLSKRKGKEG